MVIAFPTVALGGPPSTEGGAPECGATFASLVEGLLSEESASPEDVDAGLDSANELPPFESAAVLAVTPALVVRVPALTAGASGDTDDPDAAPSDPSWDMAPDSRERTVGLAVAESVGSHAPAVDVTGLSADPIDVPTDADGTGRGEAQDPRTRDTTTGKDWTGTAVPLEAQELAVRSSPVSTPEAEAHRRPDASGASAGVSEWSPRVARFSIVPPPSVSMSPAPVADAPSPSAPGVVPESLFQAFAAVPSVGRAFEGEVHVPLAAPTAPAVRLVVSVAVPTGTVDASEGDGTPRKDARGHFERPLASAADVAPAQLDAVQRIGPALEPGPDFGSPARDGSREGAPPAPSQPAVPVVLAGAAAIPVVVAPPQTTSMPASRDDDVVLPQLVRAMRLQLVGGVGEARIQLDPEHLGAVTVNLRVEGGVVSAVVIAEQPAVRHWIENHETSLRQALADQGLLLGKLHVERDGRPPGDRRSQGQDDTPRRRSPRQDTATFELLA